MQFEWDEEKRIANIKKHSIDFRDACSVFNGVTVTVEDLRRDYDEERFITIGSLNGRTIVVVHTERLNNIRLISARKATKYERAKFKSYFTNKL